MNERLSRDKLLADPLKEFERWFELARKSSGLPNPNAMLLATISPDAWPEGRPVLLKQADEKGFVFFTNYDSDKGLALQKTARAELVFHWDSLGRQIRIQGNTERVSAEESDVYFASRARESQLGAWASKQSREVQSRKEMDESLENERRRFNGGPIPRPENWGGIRLEPRRYEFWLADEHRYHDRFRYILIDGLWQIKRLFP